MVFRRPYAFLIKYFKLINLILALLLTFIIYKLNNLHSVLRQIFLGTLSNYSTLKNTYLGFNLYLSLIFSTIIIIIIIILLKRKKKPFYDYLFAGLYNIVIFIYFYIIGNLFEQMGNSIIEQTTLKTYSDISLLVFIPIVYFIIKFLLTAIGFNLKKFNFAKDLLDLKQEEKDNEEVEISFDKNSYKYIRKGRRILREFKYYSLENKFIIKIIFGILVIVFIGFLFTVNIVMDKSYRLKKSFTAGQFTIKINTLYETKYDLNYNIIKDDSKFVIANVTLKNNGESSIFDFNSIRAVYKKDYSYANNYFNDDFLDLGTPYDNQVIKQGEEKTYLFIFEIPDSYTKRSYKIRIYDKVDYEQEQPRGVYQTVKARAKKIKEDRNVINVDLKKNVPLDQVKYGKSNITVNNYELKNSYVYTEEVCDEEMICKTLTKVIRDKNTTNRVLLILDYKLDLDSNNLISSYFTDDKEFFNNFLKIKYSYNGKSKTLNSVEAIASGIDNKVFLSVPYEIQNASSLSLSFELRNSQIIYKLK